MEGEEIGNYYREEAQKIFKSMDKEFSYKNFVLIKTTDTNFRVGAQFTKQDVIHGLKYLAVKAGYCWAEGSIFKYRDELYEVIYSPITFKENGKVNPASYKTSGVLMHITEDGPTGKFISGNTKWFADYIKERMEHGQETNKDEG